MFLPLDKKPDWRHPPLITVILVLANVLLFYTWQNNDQRYEQEAFEYYRDSGLLQIEVRAYLQYKGQSERLSQQDLTRGTHTTMRVFDEMHRDADFQHRLDNGQVIKPSEVGYADWHSKHEKFIQLKQRVVAEKYGLNPAQPSTLTLFSNMFLHGNDGHLIGNMIVLLLLGFGVEIILGRWLYLVGYLFCGVSAGLAYVFINPGDTTTSVGASGAIAGVLGMAVMIYGFRKINFFYFLFIYFDYVKARAIWIIPLYILSQLIIEFVFDTNINIAAHLGGFFAGIVYVAVLKLIPNVLKSEQLDASQRAEQYRQSVQSVQQQIAAMNIEQAHEELLKLQTSYPNDQTILQLRFTIAKFKPASDEYHDLAQQILNLPGSDKATVKLVHDTFLDYAAKAKPKPKWTPELMISLATRFAANDYLAEAEQLVNHMINTMQDFPRNAEGLFALAKYFNGTDKQKAQHYRELLTQLFPDSMQARHLQQSAT